MFRIPCPHCGLRNVSEFRHAGEQRTRPEPQTVTPSQWRNYLYDRHNAADWSAETWYHAFGCRKFVSVERHTVTNEVRPAAGAPDAGPTLATGGRTDPGAPDAGGTR